MKKMMLVAAVIGLAWMNLSATDISYFTLEQLTGYTFIKVDRVEKVWKAGDYSSERIYVLRSSGKFLVSDYQHDPYINNGYTQVAIFAKREVTDPTVRMMIVQQRILPPYAEVALVIGDRIFKSFWQGDLFRPVAAPAKQVKRRK